MHRYQILELLPLRRRLVRPGGNDEMTLEARERGVSRSLFLRLSER
jgi:hypothetical protein